MFSLVAESMELMQRELMTSHLFWGDKHIPFDGHPYYIVGCRFLICHQGRDNNLRKKQKYAEENVSCFIFIKH